MYSLSGYGEMIADEPRMNAYAQAIRQTVRPGDVVVDIGAGTGIMSLLACQCGAGKVYAIEPSDMVHLLREVARANGFADRIEVIQDLSTKVSLPEPAQVIVSDLRGVLPAYQHIFPSIMDARQRLLAPGGKLLPRKDRLWVALEGTDKPEPGTLDIWKHNSFGLDLSAALSLVTNSWWKVQAGPEQVRSQPRMWSEVDYLTLTGTNLKGEVCLEITEPGLVRGLLLWFDTELTDGIGFSAAPGQPKVIYGQAFFPWPEEVCLEEGDLVEVCLRADLVRDDYIWGWDSTIRRSDNPNKIVQRFQLSTFRGAPLVPEKLAKFAAHFKPYLNEDGQVARHALEKMTGETSQGDLARDLAERFPQRFPSWHAALDFLVNLSQKFSK